MKKAIISIGSGFGESIYIYDFAKKNIVGSDLCNLDGTDITDLIDGSSSIEELKDKLDKHIDMVRCHQDFCGCHLCYIDYDIAMVTSNYCGK